MMPEPSERSKPVLAWRQKNREEGLRPISVWLPADVKYLLEDIASQRRQTVGEVIADAIRAFKPGTSVAAPATLQQLIQKEVSAQLRRQQAPTRSPAQPPTPPPAPESLADRNQEAIDLIDADEHSERVLMPDTPAVADATEKAAIVARLEAMRAEGMSLKQIKDQLNAEGVPTLSRKGSWQKGTVDKLLHGL